MHVHVHRDRAEERRQGINPDYDEHELAALTGDAVAKLTVEETKYLGGDIDHTHLVRGLDFQLLNRVREELHKKKSSKKKDESDELPEAVPVAPASVLPTRIKPPRDAPPPVKHVKPEQPRPAVPAGPSFATPLGRRVYDAIFRPPRVDVAQHFLPRRTAFVYELDAQDVPTTLRRSQADCPKVEERLMAVVHEQLMQRIATIMSHVGPSGKRRKKAQRLAEEPVVEEKQLVEEKPAVEVAPPPVEDLGDIFEDAGTEYEPTLPSKDAAPRSTAAPGVFAEPAPKKAVKVESPSLPDTQALVKEVEEGDDEGYVVHGGGALSAVA